MASAPDSRSCPVACAHCRTPLARDASDAFCCRGCRAAHALIHGAGLDRYYALANGPGTPGDPSPSSLSWLSPLLESARTIAADPRRVTVTVDVQGLHCAACVWLIRALFERRAGAHHLDLNPGLGRLALTIDPALFPLTDFIEDLARVGYRTGPARRDERAASDGLGIRLGITAAIAMNGMALSFATYLGLEADDPDGLSQLFGWVNLALSTLALAVAGPVFFRGAWQALRHRSLHLDVPIALGVGLAWLGSVVLFVTGRPELAYFDTLELFLALMLLGRWAQRRLLDRGRRLLLEDDGLEGARMKVVDADGSVASRPLTELREGQRLLLSPGELLPVAASLSAEATDFDLAWITGESEPRTFTAGQVVPAGAHLVGRSACTLVAHERFAASALHELVKQSASDDSRAGRDRFWHRLTIAWVVAVLAFAALTALIWWPSDPLLALRHATAVLVVTCPCAIGLATPLAYELAHLRLRKKALLPRRPGLLDRAQAIRHVVFDKTGTLTLTEPELASSAPLSGLTEPETSMLHQLSARSNHPKSRAIQAALPRLALDESIAVTEIPGRGLLGPGYSLASDGQDLVFAQAASATEPAAQQRVLARFGFRETLRPAARAEVARLHAAGLDVHIASGDAQPNVTAVASALGIAPERAHGGLSPEAKAALVVALGANETLVLGDGVNDTLAFEAAAVAGTPAIDRPVLPARADFVLLGSGIGPLAELVSVARHTRRLTLRNAGIAGIYNALALVAGLAGWLSPLIAAVAMPLSSLFVIALTLASRPPAATPDRAPESTPGAPLWMPST